MVFKRFRIQIILRVVLLTAAITLLSWCLVQGLFLRSIYIGAGILILLVEFIAHVERFNRDVKTFMTSLMQRDFTTHFDSSGKGKSFDELYEMLNRISSAFKKLSSEKEVQYRFLEMLVEHLRVGVLSVDADDHIHIANQAMKDLLRKNVLTNLKTLESVNDVLVKTIREIRTGETRLVKMRINSDLLQLSIHASEIKLEDRYYKLISMQNIRNELDAREMEAWQKLIRVLSHEIMNSVSPIISLSGTLHGLVQQNNTTLQADEYNSLDKGLEAIKIRSEGLYNFTQSYRKLTGIPKLSLQQTNVKDIVERIQILMQPKMKENNIEFRISDVNVPITADPELMEHVLINLLLNAIEALSGRDNGRIAISTSVSAKGNNCIHVIDNGRGIDEQTMDKIFIPFFTTRRNGSGIGLAITKQILQLHNADIQLTSEPGKGTEFIITL